MLAHTKSYQSTHTKIEFVPNYLMQYCPKNGSFTKRTLFINEIKIGRRREYIESFNAYIPPSNKFYAVIHLSKRDAIRYRSFHFEFTQNEQMEMKYDISHSDYMEISVYDESGDEISLNFVDYETYYELLE